ncbi:MAG: hypothetical protein QXJ14_03865 [Candidatus Aenigmatarchaeota archaeon]
MCERKIRDEKITEIARYSIFDVKKYEKRLKEARVNKKFENRRGERE